jgi:hypothetical protein
MGTVVTRIEISGAALSARALLRAEEEAFQAWQRAASRGHGSAPILARRWQTAAHAVKEAGLKLPEY